MGLWRALAVALGGGMVLAWLLVLFARTVATAAQRHRFQVFTHLKENADPQPMRPVKDETFFLSQDGTIHLMQKRWLAEELNADPHER